MFKQATVDAASIPATQTNFPVYVDLSRVGITTLAQAQSSRWYEDSAKLVEMPREVVSATEGHGKYSSLTSTSQLFIDYDGIRADYAVTDTYGHNAVWSGYRGVWHLDSSSVGSTGAFTGTDTSIDYSAGKIGGGADYNATSDRISCGDGIDLRFQPTDSFSASAWIKPTTIDANRFIMGRQSGSNFVGWSCYLTNAASPRLQMDFLRTLSGNKFFQAWALVSLSAGTLYKVDWTYGGAGGTSLKVYLNGVAQTMTVGTNGLDGSITQVNNFNIGNRDGTNLAFNGQIDEPRVIASELSANWITTEYNNQSDEATFWGTWTDVPGAGGTEYILTCEAGTLVLDAAPSALSLGRTITAEAGTLSLAAEPATLGVGRTLSLETGALALTGTPTSLTWSTSLVAVPGNLSLEAQNAALRLSYSIDAQTLDLAISDAPATISVALTQPLEPGSLLLSGEPVDFLVASIINPFCPMPKPFINSASPFSQMDNPLTDFPKGEC